ncbi:MAG: DUF4316 domain-containing protein [Clostridiales bacterium]|nr:DUF4316 domain-containing protein [Clostridiales bacterium]
MKNNQFALYRVDKQKEGKKLWQLSYQEVSERHLPVRIDSYKVVHVDVFDPEEKANEIWQKIKDSTEVSDVLMLNRGGEISCFYINEDYLRRINGFININPTGAVVTSDTTGFKIEGYEGDWQTADDIIINGEQFFLMENQKYNGTAAGIIVDSYGKMIVDQCKKGFDERTKRKLIEYVQAPEKNKETVQQQRARLEIWQKYYQNGTYERSQESGTEANYNTVDGVVNNQKQKNETKPKKRTSVIKKLRDKQVEIAKKSGRPIPKYLEQQMTAERSRK